MEGLVGKVVENQTANASIGIEVTEALQEIATDPLNVAREVVRTRDQIEAGHRGLRECLMDFTAQPAFARADLQNPIRVGTLSLELPHQPPGVAKVPVDQPQIRPTPDCARICWIKRIEDLRDNDAVS